jgi:predicted component of type VI protein secretion system
LRERMQITIQCLSGSLAGKTLKFDQPEISLGRGEQQKKDIDFLDMDTAVSRNHGIIFVRDERIYYTDQSRGGTLARGEKIRGATIELQPEDELQLGGKNGPRLKVGFRLLTVVDTDRLDRAVMPQAPAPSNPGATVMQPGSPPPPPSPTANSTILQGIDGAKSASIPPPKASPAKSPAEKTPQNATGGETVFQSPLNPTPSVGGETIFQAPSSKAVPSPEGGETMFQEIPPRTPKPARSDATYFQGAEADPGSTVFQGASSPVEDTGATILQDSPNTRTVPWVPIAVGLAAVAGAVWFFFLR